mmetsp:Transcript_9572/g.26839  ORF Transcript_9572/g.26839 Transcript_9572/m.26839 type:complete len:915 (-) Transcript_9572:45-2789(-)|eukprot:CAMPEP_0119131900 /NCGR_PEP_ID=MMETSP1310-20130426/10857_1 /TAXON_ID=464262 /ORGANISM="Genus nov. species nov., Strain RCC2339" /LENGTH=914 /DNA_ID=CAMNT_0007122497 /DNA_START=132 /DNA_END=2876 /DNA_ORIENTATION=+
MAEKKGSDAEVAVTELRFTAQERMESGDKLIPATVKNVLSGDTLAIVRAPTVKGAPPPADEIIRIAAVRAPQLGRIDYKERIAHADEPYAWTSREYLRNLLIGQRIYFAVEFTDQKSSRNYCTVYHNNQHVGIMLARGGMVKVLGRGGKHEPRPDKAEMQRLEDDAQAREIGIYNPKDRAMATREVKLSFDSLQFFNENKNVELTAVVDQVRNGTTVRAFILDPKHPNKMNLMTIRFAGVQAPVPSYNAKEEDPPFAKEAKQLLEQVLLSRTVKVHLECLDKQDGVAFARVLFQNKDPAELMLQVGLARFVQWNCPRNCVASYTKIEGNAQRARLRLWSLAKNQAELKNAKGAPSSSGSNGDVSGVVGEILNGGGIVIFEGSADNLGPVKQHVVYMASLSVPRLAPHPEGTDDPFAWEAKELLRSRLIGKSIRATLDYVRPATDSLPERPFYSVFLGKMNVSVYLLERGLAKLVRHRDSDPRSASYGQLLNVEHTAQKKSKGVHGPADKAPQHHVTELSRGASFKKSNQFLPYLKKGDRVAAVVEYVFGGDKVKLYCPKATCMINFSLAGVRCPRTRKGESDPVAEAVLGYVRRTILQRDVNVEVENVDKGGSFLGKLFVKELGDFGLHLVAQGMAQVHEGSARRMARAQDYFTAEKDAQAKRLLVWKNYDPEAKKKAEDEGSSGQEKQKAELLRLTVSEIVNGGTIFAQRTDALPRLEKLEAELAETLEKPDRTFQPEVGDVVAASFDTQWCRGKILSVAPNKKEFEVLFLDYGSVDFLPPVALRRLDPRMTSADPFAKEYHLAYIRPPALSEEFGRDAALYLRDLAYDKVLLASKEYEEDGLTYINIGNPEESFLVNASLVQAGLARMRVLRQHRNRGVVEKIRVAEEYARKQRTNMWQYGDLPDDELDEPM